MNTARTVSEGPGTVIGIASESLTNCKELVDYLLEIRLCRVSPVIWNIALWFVKAAMWLVKDGGFGFKRNSLRAVSVGK